jgi:hypothetical protein
VTHILRPGKASEKTPKGVIPPSLCEISQYASSKKKEEDNIMQEVRKGTNQIDPRDNPEEKIHLTRPVHDKMRGNKKEAKVERDCQDPTEHIKKTKKTKKTDLIHNNIAGKELDASLTELNHGDEIDFHRMSAEEMPVLTLNLEFPCDACFHPKIGIAL